MPLSHQGKKRGSSPKASSRRFLDLSNSLLAASSPPAIRSNPSSPTSAARERQKGTKHGVSARLAHDLVQAPRSLRASPGVPSLNVSHASIPRNQAGITMVTVAHRIEEDEAAAYSHLTPLARKNKRKEPEDYLHLDLSKDISDRGGGQRGRSKITSMRGLSAYCNLTRLNLAGNAIQTVEHISQLHALQELDLSRNSLHTNGVQELEKLSTGSLKHLSLAGNFIQHIPHCLKTVVSLETLDLSGNSISQLRELQVLSGLVQLHSLSMQGNPMCELPHYREYASYMCRSVCTLDTRAVTDAHRDAAIERFAKLDNSAKSSLELSKLQASFAASEKVQGNEIQRTVGENERLKEELRATRRLLEKRSSEWAFANERMTELQQEVAFYKIDHHVADWDMIGGHESRSAPRKLSSVGGSVAAFASLNALLSPEFDWVSGIVDDTTEVKQQGADSDIHDGIIYRPSLSVSARKAQLKQLPSILTSMQHARKDMEVECGVLRKEEAMARQALGVASAKLESLELESHALERLGKRVSKLLDGSTSSRIVSPQKRGYSNAKQERGANSQKDKIKMADTTYSSTDEGNTDLHSSLSRSRMTLNTHKGALITKLKESEQLATLQEMLEKKLTATQDLLVARTEALVAGTPEQSQTELATNPLELEFKKYNKTVTSLAEKLELSIKTRPVSDVGESSTGNFGPEETVFDRGITDLTLHVQNIMEQQEEVKKRMNSNAAELSSLEANVLSQAQIVEDEDAHREAVENGQETEDGEGLPSPKKRNRVSTSPTVNHAANLPELVLSKLDLSGSPNTEDPSPDEGPLSLEMLSPVHVPEDPAEALRRTLASLDGSVAKSVGGDGSASVLPRKPGESARGHYQRVVERARVVSASLVHQREKVRSLKDQQIDLKVRMLTAEKALLSIRLDIATTETRLRRLQFRAVVAKAGLGDILPSEFDGKIEVEDKNVDRQREEEEEDEENDFAEGIANGFKKNSVNPTDIDGQQNPLKSKHRESVSNPNMSDISQADSIMVAGDKSRQDRLLPGSKTKISSPEQHAQREPQAWSIHFGKSDRKRKEVINSLQNKQKLKVAVDKPDLDKARGSQFHFALRQLLSVMNSGRSLYGKQIGSPDLFFEAVDRDADGEITRDEFRNAMKRLDVNLTAAQVDDLLFAMGIMANGTIKYFELTNALLTELRIMEQEQEEERIEMLVERAQDVRQKNKIVKIPVSDHKTRCEKEDISLAREQQKLLYQDPKANISNSPQAMTTNPEIRAENALRRKLKAAAFRVGGVNWREVFRVFAQEKSKARRRGITRKDLRRGIRKDGNITSSLFSDKNVDQLFAAIDFDKDERASYHSFVQWMEAPRLRKTMKLSSHTPPKSERVDETVGEQEDEAPDTDTTQKSNMPAERAFVTHNGRAISKQEAVIYIEEEFVAAMRTSLRSQEVGEKQVDSVVNSVMYMIRNSQSEKAKYMALRSAFSGSWPDGVIFPPEFDFEAFAVLKTEASTIRRQESVNEGVDDNVIADFSKVHAGIGNDNFSNKLDNTIAPVLRIHEDISPENQDELRHRTGGMRNQGKHPAMSFGRRIIDPDDIAVKMGKVEVGSKERLSSGTRRIAQKHGASKQVRRLRSLPWEIPHSPVMRDEFGTFTMEEINSMSSSYSKKLRSEGKHSGTKLSLERIGSKSEQPKDQPIFITASRRRSLFGQESTFEVVNAKSSRGASSSRDEVDTLHSKHKYDQGKDDGNGNEELCTEIEVQQLIMDTAAQMIADSVEKEEAIKSPEIGVNTNGDICYDAESVHNPHFMDNVLSPVSEARANAEAAAAKAAAAKAAAAKAALELEAIERKRAQELAKREKVRKNRKAKESPSRPVNMSIFRAPSHPRRAKSAVPTPKSAVKMDMSLRERRRHGF